jgi:hypothetical protein
MEDVGDGECPNRVIAYPSEDWPALVIDIDKHYEFALSVDMADEEIEKVNDGDQFLVELTASPNHSPFLRQMKAIRAVPWLGEEHPLERALLGKRCSSTRIHASLEEQAALTPT